MRVATLIEELQKLQAAHGNMEVCTPNRFGDFLQPVILARVEEVKFHQDDCYISVYRLNHPKPFFVPDYQAQIEKRESLHKILIRGVA